MVSPQLAVTQGKQMFVSDRQLTSGTARLIALRTEDEIIMFSINVSNGYLHATTIGFKGKILKNYRPKPTRSYRAAYTEPLWTSHNQTFMLHTISNKSDRNLL